MSSKLLVLECISNMHVGNGDVNFSIIDNEVEKDPVTNYPTINASGVKGAFREYFRVDDQGKKVDGPDSKKWFGDDKEKSQGMIKILSADMLAMPLRASKGNAAFYLTTSATAIGRINELAGDFLGRSIIPDIENASENKAVEGIDISKEVSYKEKIIAVISDEEFRGVQLPVMARNKLDNGISKNLWYEEIVPHGSIFVVPVVCEQDDELEKFINSVKGKIVQFGGNASIGYGLCKISVEE